MKRHHSSSEPTPVKKTTSTVIEEKYFATKNAIEELGFKMVSSLLAKLSDVDLHRLTTLKYDEEYTQFEPEFNTLFPHYSKNESVKRGMCALLRRYHYLCTSSIYTEEQDILQSIFYRCTDQDIIDAFTDLPEGVTPELQGELPPNTEESTKEVHWSENLVTPFSPPEFPPEEVFGEEEWILGEC